MTERHRRLLPWLALLVIYVVWGSTYMAIAVVVRELPPFAAAALRFGAAGLAMGGLALLRDRDQPRLRLRAVLDYSLVGVLLLSVGNALVMWSEKRIPSGTTALIVGTVPLWITFVDGLRSGGQPWTVRVWTGTFLGLAGVALVARPEGALASSHWGAVLAVQVAALSWSFGSLYVQSIRVKLPLFTASAVEMLAAAAVLVVESLAFGEDWSLFARASGQAWLAIGYLAVFGSLIGFTAFAYCLNELPASTVGTYAYVNPVVAVILGSVFLGERLSAGLVAGGALILAAVLLTTRRQQVNSRQSTVDSAAPLAKTAATTATEAV